MGRRLALLLVPLAAGCATVPPPSSTPPAHARGSTVPPTAPKPPPEAFRSPQLQRGAGLDSVIQKTAAELVREFGPARLDVHEGDMRKLQFAGEPCVLDVYLYPLHPGDEPVATYVDARRASDGLDVDRASCIAALMR